MRNFIATAKNRELDFGSVLYTRMFRDHLAENEGQEFRISKKKPSVSDKIRAYYWAAVIPTLKERVHDWKDLTPEQVHEVAKKLFNYFDAWNPLYMRTERFGGSVMTDSSTSAEAMDYIAKIEEWLTNTFGEGLPNPEEYKRIRDTQGEYNM